MRMLRVMMVGVAAATIAFAQDAPKWEKMLKSAKVDMSAAVEKARKEAGGTVIHAELEGDKRVVYSIDVAKGDKSVNVLIDAADGSVVESQEEDEDHSDAVRACKIAIDAAVATALKKSPGAAVECEVIVRGDKGVIEVKIMNEGKLSTVRVDAATGELVKAQEAQSAFTEAFRIEDGELGPTGENPYFSLMPGDKLTLEGKDEGKDALLTITVLDETKKVAGVETRIIEERETVGGELIEVSRNYYAISKRTNSVYYFGEDVDMYKGGKVVSHDGAWLAGEKDARFGLMMAGTPILGARYYQEIAPKVAMDRAEIVGVDDVFDTPAGKFEHCVKTEETTPLERGRGYKIYAPGVGLLCDGSLKLTKHERGKK